MRWFGFLEKTGSIGVLASTLGCAACFPAIATLSASIGLGVISGYEVLAITILMPMFAGLALVVNLAGWYRHRLHIRGALGVLGPAVALAMLFPRWFYIWNTSVFYAALVLMLTMSIYDLLNPPAAKTALRNKLQFVGEKLEKTTNSIS